jgi:hypothetical protein
MRYVSPRLAGTLGPKLFGTYERQLHPFVEELIALEPAHVIVLGSAEGYYAVGLLMRLLNARLTAFEAQKRSREALHELARLNGVDGRLTIRGLADTESLASALIGSEHSVVICDIEGAEDHVLNPTAVTALQSCDILVELHDLYVPGVSRLIRQRFSSSHTIQEAYSNQGPPPPPSYASGMSPAQFASLTDERRKEVMTFFWMKCRR